MTALNIVSAAYAKSPLHKRRRVPVLLQMNEVECGAACLAMILSYFGRNTRVAACRDKCEGGRDGVNARALVTAARELGLQTRAFAVSAHQISTLNTPAILHWNNNHFVVLEDFSEHRVQIVDPATGRRTLTPEEFRAAYSQVALTFEPGADFQTHTAAVSNPLLNYLKRLSALSGMRRTLAEILAASLVLQLFGFALPFFTKQIVDTVLPAHNVGLLGLLGVGAAGLALVNAIFSYLRNALLIRLENRTDEHLMLGFFEHMLALPFRFFQQRNSGDLLMRLASNSNIRDALASYTVSAVLDCLLVIVFLSALLVLAPSFGLAALAFALLEVGVLLGSTRSLNSLLESELACQAESQSTLVEALMGIGTLKAAGAEDATLSRWSGLLRQQLHASARRSRFAARMEAASGLVRTFAPLGLLWLGGVEVSNGVMTLGSMFAMSALAAGFLQPLGTLVMSGQRIQLVKAYLERIADVMEAEREQNSTDVQDARCLTGHIELVDVHFRYHPQSDAVVGGVNLTIKAGQKVAIVGRTGSGKTTLAKLLLGLYEPSSGEILYDGKPLRTLRYPTVRRQWGTVMQDTFVFSASVRDNITFNDKALSQKAVERAADLAGIHGDILAMPMGYETRIGEGGNSLSGGQRQRLAIARALAPNPKMLLLDEATSQLDAVTEAIVDRHLNELGCTRVVVAHRLSTVRNADLIVVMRDGQIAEKGRHDDLMVAQGEYAQLVRTQAVAEAPASNSTPSLLGKGPA